MLIISKSKRRFFSRRRYAHIKSINNLYPKAKMHNIANIEEKLLTNTSININPSFIKDMYYKIQNSKFNYEISNFLGITIITILTFVLIILLGIYPSEGKTLRVLGSLKAKNKHSIVLNQAYSGLIILKDKNLGGYSFKDSFRIT